MRFLIALVLAFAPPAATWDAQGRLFVSWSQDVSGERCITKEAKDGTLYDYGCYWFFGLLGFPVGTSLPFGVDRPAESYPRPGDVIIVNGERVTVPLHLQYLPVITAP